MQTCLFGFIKIMKHTVVVIFLMAILSSITFGRDTFQIKLNLTIGSEEDSLLYRWVSVAVDNEGNMYVTDMLDCSVKKFDNRGNFVKKKGQRGQGPGEFASPAIIRYYDGHLYVSEQQIPGIQIFDRDLNFLKRIPLNLPVFDFYVFAKNSILLLSPMHDGYCYVDEKGNMFKKISFMQNSSNNIFLQMKRVAADKASNKYILSLFQGLLEKYDKNDRRIWTVKLQKNPGELKFKKLQPSSSIEVPEKILYKGIACDKNGRVLVLIGQAAANSSRSIMILNSSGQQIGEVPLQEASHYLFCDKNNRIYVGRNQGTSLKAYTLETKQAK